MKKKILPIILLSILIVSTVTLPVGCDFFNKDPIQLETPVIILRGDTATWEANLKAKRFDVSLNGSLMQCTNNTNSKKLVAGQSIRVRAVGDGEKYLTSEWSNRIIYNPTGGTPSTPNTPSNPDTPSVEPSHVPTTIATLANNKPTDDAKYIYEVKATWELKVDGELYGNGYLKDDNGNQISVYGLCSNNSVISWVNGAYKFVNDKSYFNSGIVSGAVIKVGMIYNLQYDNYSCYLISIESLPDNETPDNPDVGGDVTVTDVNFLMINDTHGAFTDSNEGYSIGRVDSLIEALESNNGEYVFIHNGDAFQGSYVSGETYGLVILEALNKMGTDCFVLGNHEFDWGIDKIAAYKDGNQANGEANFPFLGANIFYKGTQTRPNWIDPYAIVEQDGLKIGIIGIMGYGQESSILTRFVKDYEFADPINIISTNATYLRANENCDVVVVATHDYDENTNDRIAKLTGNSVIDAIFCAHTHQNITEAVTRSDSKSIPVVQCSHKNNTAKEVVIKIDENGNYSDYKVNQYYPELYSISSDVQALIDKYQDKIDESNEVIGTTSGALYKKTLGTFATESLINHTYQGNTFGDIDVSIINTGGVRATIDSGDITRADVFEVFPFNNAVVIVNLSGALIKSLYSENEGYLYMGLSDSIGSSYLLLDDDTIYQLAVIDYVFEGTYYYQFKNLAKSDYIETDVLLRDLLISYLEENY